MSFLGERRKLAIGVARLGTSELSAEVRMEEVPEDDIRILEWITVLIKILNRIFKWLMKV